MTILNKRIGSFTAQCVAGVWCAWLLSAQAAPISLEVDAREAPRKILHGHLRIQARPGALTLVYPKWIPGEHAPTGPVIDLVDIQMSSGGSTVPWERDAEDMYAFHLQVPRGADSVEVSFDFLLPPDTAGFSSGASSTARLFILRWNQVILVPQGTRAEEIECAANLRLPSGWKFATALPVNGQAAGAVTFAPVTLETLVDSPLMAGVHFRSLELHPGTRQPHWLHVAADSEAALEMKPETTAHFSQLVAETGALFGARHYRSYHFLLSLSDHIAHFGLEHHESSDNRRPEDYLTDPESLKRSALLLPHEMFHSWNGKYRRPADMATPDYQHPMKTELLWIYEGLTDYYGNVLATRCGLWTDADFRELLALDAARLDGQPGRAWRPLADTTVAAQLLYSARAAGEARRRGVEFYPEGDLIWLEADALIRKSTQGRRSLDDFCRAFHGGADSPPKVVPYSLDDVVSTLNQIAPMDWSEFFRARVYLPSVRAPLGGIRDSGWKLVYSEEPSAMQKSLEAGGKYSDFRFSLGFTLHEDGAFIDVIPDSVADRAGIAPAMKLVAVHGRRWTPEILHSAVKSAKSGTGPIELLVENEDFFTICKLDYHEGEKCPRLERDDSKPDLLSQILKPLAPEEGVTTKTP